MLEVIIHNHSFLFKFHYMYNIFIQYSTVKTTWSFTILYNTQSIQVCRTYLVHRLVCFLTCMYIYYLQLCVIYSPVLFLYNNIALFPKEYTSFLNKKMYIQQVFSTWHNNLLCWCYIHSCFMFDRLHSEVARYAFAYWH